VDISKNMIIGRGERKKEKREKELSRSGLAQKNACGAGGWNAPSAAFPTLARRSRVVFDYLFYQWYIFSNSTSQYADFALLSCS
jgi:hypothetical protein